MAIKFNNFSDEFICDKNLVKKELLAMQNLDQAVRIDVMGGIDQFCKKHSLDCSQDYQNANKLVMEVDAINLKKLKIFMQKYPWFRISDFGEDGAKAAWIMVQHTNDNDLQFRVLFFLEQLLDEQEANPEDYALLLDRLMVRYKDFGFKQKYGTQFRFSSDKTRNKLILEPYQGTLDEIDLKRKKMGMTTLAKYIEQLSEAYNIKEVE